VPVQDTVTDAARAMRDVDVGSVMVKGDLQPVDVLTDCDIKSVNAAKTGRAARRRTSAREPTQAMEKAGQR
jgi:hypothetical protein